MRSSRLGSWCTMVVLVASMTTVVNMGGSGKKLTRARQSQQVEEAQPTPPAKTPKNAAAKSTAPKPPATADATTCTVCSRHAQECGINQSHKCGTSHTTQFFLQTRIVVWPPYISLVLKRISTGSGERRRPGVGRDGGDAKYLQGRGPADRSRHEERLQPGTGAEDGPCTFGKQWRPLPSRIQVRRWSAVVSHPTHHGVGCEGKWRCRRQRRGGQLAMTRSVQAATLSDEGGALL